MTEDLEYELEPLREEADFTFYRGRQRSDQLPILAVAAAAEQPSPQSLRRLEHEFSLAKELDARWATQPLALTRQQGRTLLVLKDPGGEPLDRVVERHKGRPIDLTRFLRIAVGMTAALGHAHRQGVIHKDVKPANALVDDSGHVRLTGFGTASRVPRERLAPSPPEVIAGTLAYMSPEQTGRMNRSIDTRTDLYSLGVALYQLLTGVLPFTAADPLEWIHCHIARQPSAPIERRPVPVALSTIIMRLLAKNAEDRYQTATGLEADLQRCLTEWQLHGRIDPFLLGADDLSDRLLIPEKLYGREHEVEALLTAFDRVAAQGTAELVLVSGYSGVGKSSVVNELHKVLVSPRGLFAAGKFDQYKRDVPYATLAQAFQTLVRQILVKSQAEVDRWRRALLDALGPNGQLIVSLVPEVEFVIGKQPPVADLPPQEARHRFQSVLRRFLGAFATAEHPLALFLDDLQWLDTATLEWLESLLSAPDVRHVLLIGAYRDNEVNPGHPLMRTLTKIREAGAKTQELVLAPLTREDLQRLVADALRCGPEAAALLAELLHEKTGGNPFFAVQFLTGLAEEGLLHFDREASGWIWDLGRIRAKGYSDNAVELMVGKLRRLPDLTQAALRQLACLGNVAESATLRAVFGQSEQDTHASLLEAVHTGLILRLEGSYAFLHDRIQEAAYTLIPESERAGAHLRIGRVLLARMTADDLTEHLFDVANQLNRAATLLIDHDEKLRVAAIQLRAGRKAKSSAAYASARAYFAAGVALLEDKDWHSQYELTFRLWLERAECELLCGHSEEAEQLTEQLLPRAASKVDEAAVCGLKVQLQIMKSENQQAVTTALTCLRGFGIDMPAHPTEEQVQSDYEALWRALGGRPIESLIDLPLMTDPELQAAMQMLSVLIPCAYFTDQRLFRLQIGRMVTLSLQHGASMASAAGYAYFGIGLTAVHRYDDGYRFAKLACDLLDKYGFIANRGTVHATFGTVAAWTQPIGTVIDFYRMGIPAAIETGSLTEACFSLSLSLTYLLLRGDPLDVVWRESEVALSFVQKAKYYDVVDIVVSQQRFIATMQGRTAAFSTFNDAQFTEATFEAQLTGERTPMMVCWYWVLKLKARLLSGDYTAAMEAAGKAKPLLQALTGQIGELDYFLYAALTMSALHETASADQQQSWRELLTAHEKQLREWAENYPPTFADKLALVSAEIARLEKRDADALRLYEQAIQLARENGFVQNEGLAQELAAQYCLSRGIETAGYAYLRNARNCYDRWGAQGKVRQLDERYPRLREERVVPSSATIVPSVVQLDIETVVRASQALSSEMLLRPLIERLMVIALQNAGADRGLLIRQDRKGYRIEAEARSDGDGIVLDFSGSDGSSVPEAVIRYVMRTQETVILDDASQPNLFSEDPYLLPRQPRSILCLPLVRQGALSGLLYLENALAPGVFTPERARLLELLASQAAISLENATLYTDLELQVGLLQHLPASVWTLERDGTPDFVNQVWLEFAGQDLDFVRSHPEAWTVAIHPEDREATKRIVRDAVQSGRNFAMEYRALRSRDGAYRSVLSQAVVLRNSEGQVLKFVGTTTDIDDQKRAEEALHQAHADLARANRVTTMGELTATLTHEIAQPITGVITNAKVCLRRLMRDEPELDELRTTVTRLIRDAQRAADIINKTRSQFEKGSVNREALNFGEVVGETINLLRREAVRYNISVLTELAADLPQIVGDRVQLQQVAMNLIVNSIEAMKDWDGPREMVIKSQRGSEEQILVSVSDTGIGFPPQLAEQLFEPFFTTKTHGTGMGLRISRSIIESHGGHLWAEGAAGRGATFYVSLPTAIAS